MEAPVRDISTQSQGEQRIPPALLALGRLRPQDWARIVAWSVVVGAAIAIPTRLVPNGWFRRMTPTRPQDYAFWIVGSLLAGLVLGLRYVDRGRQDAKAIAGGLGTLFAVGCPVCNKLVVALIGASGALGVFAPLQPVLAVASIALLAWALWVRLQGLTASACVVDP